MMKEPLKQMPRHKWPVLQKMFEKNWPQGLTACCLLDMQISYPNLSKKFDFKVYCPEGDTSLGMITTIKLQGSHQITLNPTYGHLKKLEESVLRTDVIDWNKDIMVAAATDEIVSCLEVVKDVKGVEISTGDMEHNGKAYVHVLKKDTQLFEISCPYNTYVGSLKPEFLELIDKTWTFHNETSLNFFKILMDNGLTYVLYSSKGNPVCWVTIDENGAMTHLYCVEEHRKKGYAEFLTKYVANEWLRREKTILSYTVDGNEKAKRLFEKIGFETVGSAYWLYITKRK